jgi:carboxyl-terminal processing protease
MKLRTHPRLSVLVLALVLLAGGCALAPTEYREPPPLTVAERADYNRRVFERTWELVNEKYFDAKFRGVDWPAMRTKYRPEAAAAVDDTALYQVLNRLCAELKESHLAAISPRRAHEYRTEHRASVGFRMQMIEDRRVVTDVVPGSPAAAAGIKTGWLVASRNGAPLQEKDPYLPKLGQPVAYEFIDADDQPHSLTMEPQLLDFDQLDSRGLADGYRYLRFDEFSHKSLHWLSEQLKAESTAPGVVIDLRNNPGGNMLALNVALAEFFPRKVAAGRMIKRNGREQENQSLSWLSARYGGRVVILTDNSTGSAAEIFSHVLQHHKRATVIGRRTAGAVIVSRNYELPGGGRLQVPVSDYIGADGRRLEGRGVTPDVALPSPTLADLRTHHDPDLEAALHALQQNAPATAGPKKTPRQSGVL